MSNFDLVERAMREAKRQAARSHHGYYGVGAAPGSLSDWLGQWRDAWDMITGQPNPQQQMLQHVAMRIHSAMSGGNITLPQAIHQVFTADPGLLFELPASAFENSASFLKMMNPQTYKLGPGEVVKDASGNTLASNPKPEQVPADVALAMFAANGDPTKARAFAAKHFDRQPTEFDQLKASMSPDQWKQYLANKASPPGAEHTTMWKLVQERDAAKAQGNYTDAKSYQDAIDALPKQNLLQSLLNNGGNGGGFNIPGTTPSPAPNPQPGTNTSPPNNASGSGSQPSPGDMAIRGAAIKQAVDQAISTKQPVTFVDPLDKSTSIITPDKAQMILQNMQAQPQPQSQPQPTPAPAPAPTPTPQQ